MGTMSRADDLRALADELAANASLPLVGSANLVFGEGSPEAAVMFIGEAPGANEDMQKRPFVGRAGQLLRRMIREVGWNEADVYITNIVKRRPPENRDPLPEEIMAYEPYLTRQIATIAPRVIVPLGRFAMNYFLPEAKITRDNGRTFRVDGRLVVPLFHPAAALRATEVLRAFEETFRKLPDIVAGKLAPTVPLPPAFAPGASAGKPTKKTDQPRLF